MQTYLTENHLNSGVFYGPYSDPYAPQPLYPNPTAYPADRQHPGGPVRLHLDTPGPCRQGRTLLEFFLLESRQGYCVHFATAGPRRCCGPWASPPGTRRATPSPPGEEGWVDVPDYNAHAWVEVYFGGAGWIPFEVTPRRAGFPRRHLQRPSPGAGGGPHGHPGAHALPHATACPHPRKPKLPQRPPRRPRLPPPPCLERPGRKGKAPAPGAG